MNRQLLAALARMNPRDVERGLTRIRNRAAKKHSRLVARREKLAQRVDALDREIALLENGHAPTRGPRARRKVSRPRKGQPTARDVAFEVLTKMRAPMALKDLARAVLATGKVKSKSPAFAQNLGLAMRADRRFKKVGLGLYAAGGAGKPVAGSTRAKRKRAARKGPQRKRGSRKGRAVRKWGRA